MPYNFNEFMKDRKDLVNEVKTNDELAMTSQKPIIAGELLAFLTILLEANPEAMLRPIAKFGQDPGNPEDAFFFTMAWVGNLIVLCEKGVDPTL